MILFPAPPSWKRIYLSVSCRGPGPTGLSFSLSLGRSPRYMDRRKSPSSLSYQQASSLTRAQPSSCALVTYERAGGQPKCRPSEPSNDRKGGSARITPARSENHYTQSRRDWLKRSDHRSPRVVPRRLARTCRVEFRNVKKERSCFASRPLGTRPPSSSFLFPFFFFSLAHVTKRIFLERFESFRRRGI